jgi:hypothetical protein
LNRQPRRERTVGCQPGQDGHGTVPISGSIGTAGVRFAEDIGKHAVVAAAMAADTHFDWHHAWLAMQWEVVELDPFGRTLLVGRGRPR